MVCMFQNAFEECIYQANIWSWAAAIFSRNKPTSLDTVVTQSDTPDVVFNKLDQRHVELNIR